MTRRRTTGMLRPARIPDTSVSEPESESMQIDSVLPDPPLGDTAPTVMADTTNLNSRDSSLENKGKCPEDADAMGSSEDDKTTSLTAAGADGDTGITASGKKRNREPKLWFRNLSPVRTRSSTGKLPGAPMIFPEGVTPNKPRKPRATPRKTSAAKKSRPTRKRKSTSAGGARKRSKKSLTLPDKQVEGGMGDAGQDAEVDQKDESSDEDGTIALDGGASSHSSFYDDSDIDASGESDGPDFMDGVTKTPYISDHAALSPGSLYHESDTDASGESDGPDPMDGVTKILDASGPAALSPGSFYGKSDTDACGESGKPAPMDRIPKILDVSGHAALSLGSCYDESDTDACGEYDGPDPMDGVTKAPDVCGPAALSSGGCCDGQDTDARPEFHESIISNGGIEPSGSGQSELPASNGSGTPIEMGSQGLIEISDGDSTDFPAGENVAEDSEEANTAIPNDEQLGETNPTGYQAEDGPSVQYHPNGVEPGAEPQLNPAKLYDPNEGNELEAQEFGRSNKVLEVANFDAPSDIKYAIMVPSQYLAPEDFITNARTLIFKHQSEFHSKVTHFFIYIAWPISQILFVGSITPVGTSSSPSTNENGGTGPSSTNQSSIHYKINSLWQLAEGIPLEKLKIAYGYEGPPLEPIEVCPEILAAYPLAGMQKIF